MRCGIRYFFDCAQRAYELLVDGAAEKKKDSANTKMDLKQQQIVILLSGRVLLYMHKVPGFAPSAIKKRINETIAWDILSRFILKTASFWF